MVSESDFTWIVIAPGGAANMRLACEAARAGAWGFVDLEDVRDAEGFGHAFPGSRRTRTSPWASSWTPHGARSGSRCSRRIRRS